MIKSPGQFYTTHFSDNFHLQAAVRAARCCYFPCKIQNSKFGRGCGQILNFEFCGVGSQSSPVAVVAVVAARAAATCLAKVKIKILAADATKFRFFMFAVLAVNRRRSPSSVVVGRRRSSSVRRWFQLDPLRVTNNRIRRARDCPDY